MQNFMQYMDEDDEEFGPQQAPLSSVQKEDLYASIMQKHDPQVAEARAAAESQRRMAGIGSALEGLGRAKGVARGGAGVDQSFYKDLGKMKDSGVDDAIGDRSMAVKKYLMDKQETRDDAAVASKEKLRKENQDWRQSQSEKSDARDARDFAQRERGITATQDRLARSDTAKAEKLERKLNPTHEQRLEGLGGEERKRLDSALMGSEAVDAMEKALNQGTNTFSVIGDNDFTMAAGHWEDAIGRMQSGGAINSEEAERFRGWAPTFTDSAEIQQKKIQWMKEEMKSRIENLGFESEGFQKKSEPFPGRNQGAISPQDQEAADWAKQNPDDPRAAKILERLGM